MEIGRLKMVNSEDKENYSSDRRVTYFEFLDYSPFLPKKYRKLALPENKIVFDVILLFVSIMPLGVLALLDAWLPGTGVPDMLFLVAAPLALIVLVDVGGRLKQCNWRYQAYKTEGWLKRLRPEERRDNKSSP